MSNPLDFFKGLKTYFGISSPNDYLCKTFLITRVVKIDIIQFDEWLHGKYGNYEIDNNMSMAQIISKKYGIEAKVFIEKYL